ncbi:MAG TPA: hypothetical protein VGC66_08540, partial [Pyrinomonadaceae bacterium]
MERGGTIFFYGWLKIYGATPRKVKPRRTFSYSFAWMRERGVKFTVEKQITGGGCQVPGAGKRKITGFLLP